MRQIFEEMIDVFKVHFKKYFDMQFTNQTVQSCEDLYRLCIRENPDNIIEIGTNYGASTIALASGLRYCGKSLDNILTVDLSHKFWHETPKIQKSVLDKLSLDVNSIKTCTIDFNNINPEEILNRDTKTLIFYDMHDHNGPWSQRLLDLWYPLLKGLIAVHDITPVPESFVPIKDEKSPRSKADYFSGQCFSGFMECERIINWANVNKIKLHIFNGGIYFYDQLK